MIPRYVALVRKRRGTDYYAVEYPDFPRCVTTGVTLDEALRSARAALALHVRGLLEDRLQLPEPCITLQVRGRDDHELPTGEPYTAFILVEEPDGQA
jgi:predicted RNase H-like HicB family nuclease